MAGARIVHTWPDGSKVFLTVTADDSYPDALDQAVSELLRLYRETCTDGSSK